MPAPPKGQRPIRVLLADDHPVLLHGLTKVFDDEPDMLVVGQAHDGRRALELAAETSPHVVVLDYQMPRLQGRRLIASLAQALPGLRILVLSLFEDIGYVVEALDAGAAGYLSKGDPVELYVHAVRSVHDDGFFIAPRLTRPLTSYWSHDGPRTGCSGEDVSVEELELMRCFARCMTVEQVARHLDLTPAAVLASRQGLLDRLQLPSTWRLIRYALQNGIGP